MFINGFEMKKLNPGACIGEKALLYKKPREATYKCLTDVFMWYIDNFVFNKVLISISLQTAIIARSLLLKVPFFQLLTSA